MTPAASTKPNASAESDLATSLKSELTLVSLLVIFVGIVATEFYYGSFGLRYQFLNLPATHILYRGLTVVPAAPYLLIPYALGFFWLYLDGWLRDKLVSRRVRSPVTYAVVIGLLAVTYPMARHAAKTQGDRDAHEATSTLPELVQMKTATQDVDLGIPHYRLLVIDGDFVVIFRPLRDGDKFATVKLRRYKKGDIAILDTD